MRRYTLVVPLLLLVAVAAAGGWWVWSQGIRSVADLRAALPGGGPDDGLGRGVTQPATDPIRPQPRPVAAPQPRPDTVTVQAAAGAAVEPAPAAAPQGVVSMPPSPAAEPPRKGSTAAQQIEAVAESAIAQAGLLAEEQARMAALRDAADAATASRAALRSEIATLLSQQGFDAARLRALIGDSNLPDSQKDRLGSLIDAAAANPQDRPALLRLIDEALA